LPSTVQAHGAPKAQHGGVVAVASDFGFELVASDKGATLYVLDHDEKKDTKGLTGVLTVLQGSAQSEAELKPAGGNKLEAVGVKLEKGAKAVAVVNGLGKKAITVRFTVR
jgi:hypothetical protein